MKKIKFKTPVEVCVTRERSIHCDFCGDKDKIVFTSDFDSAAIPKINMQICLDCVRQLAKQL